MICLVVLVRLTNLLEALYDANRQNLNRHFKLTRFPKRLVQSLLVESTVNTIVMVLLVSAVSDRLLVEKHLRVCRLAANIVTRIVTNASRPLFNSPVD